MSRRFQLIMIVIVLVGGCTTRESITRRSQLADPLELGPIKVLTKDTTLYELTTYRVVDSILVCSGTLRKGSRSERFVGTLNLTDIAYIQAQYTGFFQQIGAGLLVGAFVATAASSFDGSGLTVKPTEAFHYPAGGGIGGVGSCPYIYSWDGSRYALEAEAFGTALGKSFEYQSSHLLPSLQTMEGNVKVRIANERPETHYVNYVSMNSVECDAKATPYLDVHNVAWPIFKLEPAVAASDRYGNDVLSKIAGRDRNYWESDVRTASFDTDFEDVVDLEFRNPSGRKEGTLVIDAINTQFSTAVFEYLFRFLGDQYLPFMYALENDDELKNIFRNWLEESSLKVHMFDGKDWQKIGSVQPEANATPFSRVIRFQTIGSSNTVKIRLKSLADVWKLDAVRVDWTPVQSLKMADVPLLSAMGSDGKDRQILLKSADDSYAMLLPPQCVDFVFQSRKPSLGKKLAYVLNAQGYLYEWMTRDSKHNSALPFPIREEMKIAYLKKLLREKNLFLPPIYAEWKEHKKR